jgi:hypothetical protein
LDYATGRKLSVPSGLPELLVLVGLADAGQRGAQAYPAGSSNGAPWLGHWPRGQDCCSWTNPSRPWIPICASAWAIEVREILQTDGTTALLVTVVISSKRSQWRGSIGVMHEGRIEQWDIPWMLYHRPASRVVADFIGLGAFSPGRRDCERRRRSTRNGMWDASAT